MHLEVQSTCSHWHASYLPHTPIFDLSMENHDCSLEMMNCCSYKHLILGRKLRVHIGGADMVQRRQQWWQKSGTYKIHMTDFFLHDEAAMLSTAAVWIFFTAKWRSLCCCCCYTEHSYFLCAQSLLPLLPSCYCAASNESYLNWHTVLNRWEWRGERLR